MALSELSFYLPQGITLETARARYIDALRREHGGRIPRNFDPENVRGRAYYENEDPLEDILYRLPINSRLIVWSVAEISDAAETLSALKARASERISMQTLEPNFLHDPSSEQGLVVLKALSMALPRSKETDSRFVRRHSDDTLRLIREAKKRGRPAAEIIGQYKISRSYFYKVTTDIATLEVVTPFETAKPNVIELLERVKEGLKLDEKSSTFVTQWLMRFEKESTRTPYFSDVKKFLSFLRKSEEITSLQKIDEYAALRYQEYIRKNIKPRSQNRYLSSLKSLFSHLEKRKFVTENPFSDVLLSKVGVKTIVTYCLTTPEASAIVRHAEERRREERVTWKRAKLHRNELIFKILATTARRIGFVLDLRLSDLDLKGDLVALRFKRKTSSEKERVQLDPDTSADLREYLSLYHKDMTNHNHFLFFNSMHIPEKQAAYKSVSRAFDSACEKEGVNSAAVPHSFRVHAAVEWYKGGMPLREIQLRLDHASIEQTAKYIALALGLPPEDFFKSLKGVS